MDGKGKTGVRFGQPRPDIREARTGCPPGLQPRRHYQLPGNSTVGRTAGYSNGIVECPPQSANESISHTRPPRGTGPERPLFPYLQPPTTFGPLATAYDQPRGPSKRDGVDSFVCAPPSVTARPKIDGNSGNGFDVRLNDPLNHPLFEGYYTYEGRTFEELTSFEKRVLEMAVHYPYIQDGIMRAPMYFRTQSFTRPKAEQSSHIQKVFGSPELFDKIVGYLIPRYEDLVNLHTTCQFIALKIQSLWMHLDATTNDFWGWNKNCLAEVRRQEAMADEFLANDPNGDSNRVATRAFSPSVIISPIRPQDQGPAQKVIRSRTGYPITSSIKKPQETDYGSSMRAHYSLLHLSYINGHAIKHLILHGMPWVTVTTVKRIILRMPVLEALGVHQCFLIHLGDTQPFLKGINAINRKRLERKEPHIAADFCPYYYKGVPYKEDGSGHDGEYGVVPEELNQLDTTRAVTGQLLAIRNLCHEGNQDFFSPGTSFRSYLNRLPIRTLPSILEWIEALHEFKVGKHHADVGLPNSHKTGTFYYNGPHNPPLISEEMEKAMSFTLWSRLIVSCNGRPVLKKQLDAWLFVRGKFSLEHCIRCNTDMPAYLFSVRALRASAANCICHGCELGDLLDNHMYRLHGKRRRLAESIFRGTNRELLFLRTVLRNIYKPPVPAVPAMFGEPATSARDEILCRPRMVDNTFLTEAEKLWNEITVHIPAQIERNRTSRKFLDKQVNSYPDIFNRICRERQILESQLGTLQRSEYAGSINRVCRSWELNIRDNRAELAMKKGKLFPNGPMPIFNYESNAAIMLGSSGDLPLYWQMESWQMESERDHNEKDTMATMPQGPHHTTASSSRTAAEADQRDHSIQGQNGFQWSYALIPDGNWDATPGFFDEDDLKDWQIMPKCGEQDGCNKLPGTGNTSTTTLPTDEKCPNGSSSKTSSSQANYVLPHKRTTPAATASGVQGPAQKQVAQGPSQPERNKPQEKRPSYAATSSSQNTVPRESHPTAAQPAQHSLPHRQRPANTAVQQPPYIAPHRRRQGKQPASTNTNPSPSSGEFHRRRPAKLARDTEQPQEEIPVIDWIDEPPPRDSSNGAGSSRGVPPQRPDQPTPAPQTLLPHQRRPEKKRSEKGKGKEKAEVPEQRPPPASGDSSNHAGSSRGAAPHSPDKPTTPAPKPLLPHQRRGKGKAVAQEHQLPLRPRGPSDDARSSSKRVGPKGHDQAGPSSSPSQRGSGWDY